MKDLYVVLTKWYSEELPVPNVGDDYEFVFSLEQATEFKNSLDKISDQDVEYNKVAKLTFLD